MSFFVDFVFCYFFNPPTVVVAGAAGESFDPAVGQPVADIPPGYMCERCSVCGHMRTDYTGEKEHQD